MCESGRVDERVKGTLLQMRQDTEVLMESGLLAGECADLTLGDTELYARLEDYPIIMMDSLPTSRLPWRPKGLLAVNA